MGGWHNPNTLLIPNLWNFYFQKQVIFFIYFFIFDFIQTYPQWITNNQVIKNILISLNIWFWKKFLQTDRPTDRQTFGLLEATCCRLKITDGSIQEKKMLKYDIFPWHKQNIFFPRTAWGRCYSQWGGCYSKWGGCYSKWGGCYSKRGGCYSKRGGCYSPTKRLIEATCRRLKR